MCPCQNLLFPNTQPQTCLQLDKLAGTDAWASRDGQPGPNWELREVCMHTGFTFGVQMGACTLPGQFQGRQAPLC